MGAGDRAGSRGRAPRRPGVRGRARARARRDAARPRPRPPRSAARRGDREPLLASGRGVRGGVERQRDRHERHGERQVAVVQPARARRDRARSEAARALPLPDQGAGPGPGAQAVAARPPSFATRSTTATRRRTTGPRSGGAPTSCSPTRTCSTSACCPHHKQWGDFLANLGWVVVDEAHTYRGVFGSHVANVFRRLRRVCRLYGADPRFVCTSATIANPVELAERLCGDGFALVDGDGARTPRGGSRCGTRR